jgi:hypothetical protein
MVKCWDRYLKRLRRVVARSSSALLSPASHSLLGDEAVRVGVSPDLECGDCGCKAVRPRLDFLLRTSPSPGSSCEPGGGRGRPPTRALHRRVHAALKVSGGDASPASDSPSSQSRQRPLLSRLSLSLSLSLSLPRLVRRFAEVNRRTSHGLSLGAH